MAQVTITISDDHIEIKFEDRSYIDGDGKGGLEANTATMNNEQAQELLDKVVYRRPPLESGTYDTDEL